MITAPQIRAARALLGLDQRGLARAAGLSVPTIQRMEASDGVVRGNVDSLMKLVGALDAAGIELIGEGAVSGGGGRGVRLKRWPALRALWRGRADALAPLARASPPRAARPRSSTAPPARHRWRWRDRAAQPFGMPAPPPYAAARPALDRRPFPPRRAVRLLPRRRRSRRARRRAFMRSATAATSRRRSACCRSIPPFSPA